MEIYSHSPLGYDGDLITVETDIRRGIPGYDIVGLPDNAVKESRDRVRAALRNAGFQFPSDRVLVNLSPGDVKKVGSGFDLALALGILFATGQIPSLGTRVMALGELGLSGELRCVPGLLSAACRTVEKEIYHIIVPRDQAHEAAVVPGLNVWPVGFLSDLVVVASKILAGEIPGPIAKPTTLGDTPIGSHLWESFKGHSVLKKTLCLCATGGHHLLMYGPPGGGKSLAAKVLETLLPPLNPLEALEVSRIWSLSGKRLPGAGLMTQRPFCAPHHSASLEGLIGGGSVLRPGDVSLAHRGVLFLDEAPEFSKSILQSLREPVQEGSVRILRAGRSYTFPSDFQWVLAANPCPCGHLGKAKGLCICSAEEVRRHWNRLGGALLDRIDLRVFVESTPAEDLLAPGDFENFHMIRSKIKDIRRVQEKRNPKGVLNCRLDPSGIDELCSISSEDRKWVAEKLWKEGVSSRGFHSLLRLARTLGDWGGREEIIREDLESAWSLRYPSTDRKYWDN